MQPLSGVSDQCAAEVMEAVPAVIWFIRRQMRSHRKGLSVPQFRALALVARQPATCLSSVAELLGASLPTTSRIVSGLVRQGLMKRHGCTQDRRQVALAITEQGRAVLQTAESATRTRLSEELRHLKANQRRDLLRTMKVLRGVFGPMGQVAAGNGRPHRNGKA